MLRPKIMRQHMQHINVSGCFNNFRRLLQLTENYKLLVSFY